MEKSILNPEYVASVWGKNHEINESLAKEWYAFAVFDDGSEIKAGPFPSAEFAYDISCDLKNACLKYMGYDYTDASTFFTRKI